MTSFRPATLGKRSQVSPIRAADPWGFSPAGPRITTGYLADYMSASQRWVVTPNNDTIYGAGFADLGDEAAVIQTPADVPAGHYWTIQIVDVFTTVTHQLGSTAGTPGGKYLLVGPGWAASPPPGSLASCTRLPTSPASSPAASPPARRSRRPGAGGARADRDVPLSADLPAPGGRRRGARHNVVFPPGVTAALIAADPDLLPAGRWGQPASFGTTWAGRWTSTR